ncbi:MAG: hypothetical protein SOU19_02635, partial [Candidatus Caccosoma sp.]|nr:hypothetical protein [Candidatus Caccosoma sp.]
MIHGLNNNVLYSAKKIIVTLQKDNDRICFLGTGFFLSKNNEIILVTNRHVVEPWYKEKKYA